MPEQEAKQQPGVPDLAAFGEDLRREREIRGISLKEIADATKISGRFLEAIERNDHATLPAPVFTRGFVREYARYVGLNSEEMVSRYNVAVARDDRVEKPPAIRRYPDSPVRDITPRPPRKRGIPSATIDGNAVMLVLIAAALAAVAWWAIRSRRFEQVIRVSTRAAAPAPAKAPASTSARTPPLTESVAEPAIDDSVLRLRIRATASSWVTLEADGRTVLNAEVIPGETREFEANDEFRFKTIGNAAGLALSLNGADIPSLGSEGEVIRERVFDRPALEELRGGDGATPQNRT